MGDPGLRPTGHKHRPSDQSIDNAYAYFAKIYNNYTQSRITVLVPKELTLQSADDYTLYNNNYRNNHSIHAVCNEDEFQCLESGVCILASSECDDRRYDCSDNSDEDNPECRECSLGLPVASLNSFIAFPCSHEEEARS